MKAQGRFHTVRFLGVALALVIWAALPSCSTVLHKEEIHLGVSRSEPEGLDVELWPSEPDSFGASAFALADFGERKDWLFRSSVTRSSESSRLRRSPTVSIFIPANPRETDRVYPSLRSYDGLQVLNLDYLMNDAWPDKINVRSPHNIYSSEGCLGSKRRSFELHSRWRDRPRGRYIALSDDVSRQCSSQGNLTVLTSKGTPKWLIAGLTHGLEEQLEILSSKLGPLDTPNVLLIVGYDSSDQFGSSYRGEAGWNNTIFVRFNGSSWNEENEVAIRQIESFVAHEAVHLWIGQRQPIAENAYTALVIEGAAEYLSFIAVHEDAIPDSHYVLSEVERRLQRCEKFGSNQALAVAELTGTAIYDCGFVLQWLVDRDLSLSSGKRVWTEWEEIIANPHAQQVEVTGFLARGSEGLAANYFYADRFAERIEVLKLSGGSSYSITSRDEYPAAEALGLAVQHMLTQYCSAFPFGFYTAEQEIKLDTNASCGPFRGSPKITKINGFDVTTDQNEILRSTHERCLRKEAVSFSEPASGTSIEVRCLHPLAMPPKPVGITKIL